MTAQRSGEGSSPLPGGPGHRGEEDDRDRRERRGIAATQMAVFLSYCRTDEKLAAMIARDLTDVGVDVWRDERLSGGQAWWDTILGSIRAADAVVFVLSAGSLKSVPCGRELGYAEALDKPVLPVRIDHTSPGLAPPFLASREWVDYVADDRASVIRLMRAVNSLPPAPALPDPLPVPPEVPLSYTTNLAALVNQSDELSAHEQHSLLFQLREGLDEDTYRMECIELLKQLRLRRELLASVARQIDVALRDHKPSADPGMRAPHPGPVGRSVPGVPPPPSSAGAPAYQAPTSRQPRGTTPEVAGSFQQMQARPPFPPPVGPVNASPPAAGSSSAGSSRRWWLVVGAVLAALMLLVAVPLVFLYSGEDAPQTYGDDTTLDALWDGCEGGDLPACDTLYADSPLGSDYEEFGSTCAFRSDETFGGCTDLDPPVDDGNLDELADACSAGDLEACDDLYFEATVGSEYEVFGDSCGDRGVNLQGSCATDLPFPYTYGDDVDLDALTDACTAGDMVACDSLYFDAPVGSDYELLGNYCGGEASQPMTGNCSEE
jgi:hypothetical protein